MSSMSNIVGRPPKNLNPEEIASLIARGFTVEFVAEYLGVAVSTLYLNYSEPMRKGRAFRNGCLQAVQYKQASEGNTSLLIWLGKQWLRQREPQEPKPDPDDFQSRNKLALSESERAEAIAIARKLMEVTTDAASANPT